MTKEYYIMHHEAGISETDGPYSEQEAYEETKRLLTPWVILKWHDSIDKKKGRTIE